MKEKKGQNTRIQFYRYTIFSLVTVAIILMFFSAFLAMRSGTISVLLIKLGIKKDIPVNTDSYKSWSNCLEQLDVDVDVAFIGDSITANGNFQSLIQDKSVCNLGCYGDQVWDVTARIKAVKAVKPETLYIMIGVNTLGCRTLEQAEESYLSMADTYITALPECKIIFLSVLPVAHSLEHGARTNVNIIKFNTFIQTVAKEYNVEYIDLFPLYFLDGELNQQYTNDGLHITQDAYHLWVDAIK